MPVTNAKKTVTISISQIDYIDKKIANAAVGSTKGKKGENNRKTRIEYGLKWNDSASYDTCLATLDELFNFQLYGHSACHNFRVPVEKLKKDGSFSPSQKINKNFEFAEILFVDIDDTNYKDPRRVIEKLEKANIKPSFWLNTYNNFQVVDGVEKGLRMRLGYAVNQRISNSYFYRYCMTKLFELIVRALEVKWEDEPEEPIIKLDPCSLNCSQYFNGTNKNNTKLIADGECFNLWYDLEEFGANEVNDFVKYLENFAGYTSYDQKNAGEMRKLLEELTGDLYVKFESRTILRFVKVNKGTKFMETLNSQLNSEEDELGLKVEGTDGIFNATSAYFLRRWEFYSTNYPEFYKNKKWNDARIATPNNCRLIKYPWEGSGWQIIDEDYVAVYCYGSGDSKRILKDGQKRRINLYNSMIARRLITPSMTPDDMLVCLIRDIIDHVDNSDGVLDAEYLKRDITTIFSYSIEELKEKEAGIIKAIHDSVTPTFGMIFKDSSINRQEAKWEAIDKWYDRSKDWKWNLNNLNSNYGLFKVGEERTLRTYCKSRGINPKGEGVLRYATDEEIAKLLDCNAGRPKNKQILKENNISCGNDRLAKILRELKENGCPASNFAPNEEKSIKLKKESNFLSKEEEVRTHSYTTLQNRTVIEETSQNPTNSLENWNSGKSENHLQNRTAFSNINDSNHFSCPFSTTPVEAPVLNAWGNVPFNSSQSYFQEVEETKVEPTPAIDYSTFGVGFGVSANKENIKEEAPVIVGSPFNFETPKLEVPGMASLWGTSKRENLENENKEVKEEKPKKEVFGTMGFSFSLPSFGL